MAPAYWPIAWPSPDLVAITVRTGRESFLELDERTSSPGDGLMLADPEGAQRFSYEVLEKPSMMREVRHDVVTGMQTIAHRAESGRVRYANGLETHSTSFDEYSIREGDPCSASVECQRSYIMERGDWQIRIEASGKMHCSREQFHVSSRLDAYEGSTRVFDRHWDASIPRDLV